MNTQARGAEPREGIAIVGLAGRFPQARTLEEFWRNLSEGRDCVTDYSDDELLAVGVDPLLLQDPGYVKSRYALEGADHFDAAFFGISPVEAEVTDPQQRVL